MSTILIDSSVLFSACKSKNGASALILAHCRKGTITGYISPYILGEVKKHVQHEEYIVKQRLHFFIQQSKLQVAIPTENEVKSCEQIIAVKDASVLAAAKKCTAHYLITLDKRDFMKESVSIFMAPTVICTPNKFFKLEKILDPK